MLPFAPGSAGRETEKALCFPARPPLLSGRSLRLGGDLQRHPFEMSPAMHRRSSPRQSSWDLSRSPIRERPSPRSPPRRERQRNSPQMKSPVRNSYPQRTRSPARGKLSRSTRSPRHGRSRSPVKEKMAISAKSPRQGSSRSPVKEKSSQHTTRSPKHVRMRSPAKERVPAFDKSPRLVQSQFSTKQKSSDHARSPKQLHSSSPIRTGSSRSPSPRTKRLRRAQVERETEKSYMEDERNAAREDKRRNRERGNNGDDSNERRLSWDKSDDGTSRSSRHGRDRSISAMGGHRSRYGAQSPPQSSRSLARDELQTTRTREVKQLGDDDQDSVARMNVAEEALEEKQKQKPSFELSGKLAEETNRVRGVTLLFTEPPDARKPDVRWRLYVFKAGEVLNEPLYVHRQSCYLFGRERRVADIPTDHPSCSKQHAVLQFRLVDREQSDGLLSQQVRPYVMDLGSTNGTFVNDERIEPQRYYELREKDIIKFGNSSREYVLLHENSVK